MELHHHIHVLSGPVQGGKTSFIAEKIPQLKERGLRVGGFLCPGTIAEGRRTDFKLMNIGTGKELPMGNEQELMGWTKFRRFYFNPKTFHEGTKWIMEAIREKADLLVIDEVGPMELEGSGWSDILDFLENKKDIIQLWIVRQEIVPDVLQRWHIPDHHVYTLESIKSLFRKWEL